MPIYEYQCPECGAEVEKMQSMSAPPPDCESCGVGPMKKRISAPAFQFKGDGWYVTDYARKDKEKKEKASSGSSAGASTTDKGSGGSGSDTKDTSSSTSSTSSEKKSSEKKSSSTTSSSSSG